MLVVKLPMAAQPPRDSHDTLMSAAPPAAALGSGVDLCDQELPFQISTSGAGTPDLAVSSPTAVQTVDERQDTSYKAACEPVGSPLLVIFHEMPFQNSAKGTATTDALS